jgi:lipoate synthase
MILSGERSSISYDTPETLVEVLMPDFSKRYLRISAACPP